MEIRLNSGAILAAIWCVLTLTALYRFGVGFDRHIGHWRTEHVDEGYIALEVVLGTAVTVAASLPLIAIAILIMRPGSLWLVVIVALVQLFCFMASGGPMIWGEIVRLAHARRNDMDSARSAE